MEQHLVDEPLPGGVTPATPAIDHTNVTLAPPATPAATPAAINSKFLCPISKQRMWDPVTLIADRTTYERTVLDLWLMGIPDAESPLAPQPRQVSPTTGLPLPVPDLPDGASIDGSQLQEQASRTAAYYEENTDLRRQIWDSPSRQESLGRSLSRQESTESDYSTPRGTKDLQLAMEDLEEQEADHDWLDAFRSQAFSLVNAVAALAQVPAALQRQQTVQEEGENSEQRWERLEAAQASADKWWEQVKPFWERARALDQRSLISMNDGADAAPGEGGAAGERLRLNVSLRDGKEVHLSVLTTDSIERVIWRAACNDRAPTSLLALHFSGSHCSKDSTVHDIGVADDARVELLPAAHCSTEHAMRTAMVQHEQQLLLSAFAEILSEDAAQSAREEQAQRLEEQALQEQQVATAWSQRMPAVSKRATNRFFASLVACTVTAVGVFFSSLDRQWLGCAYQAALLTSNIALAGLCGVGMCVPVLDAPNAPFPWPLVVVDWYALGYALQGGTASRRTTICTLGANLFGFLAAICGALSLWVDPPNEESVTPWIVLVCMVLWAGTLLLPLLLAAAYNFGSCFSQRFVARLTLLMTAGLTVAAAAFGILESTSEHRCALKESVIWVVFTCSFVNTILILIIVNMLLKKSGDQHCLAKVVGGVCVGVVTIMLGAAVSVLNVTATIYGMVVLLTSDCADGDERLIVLVVCSGVLLFAQILVFFLVVTDTLRKPE